MRAVKAQLRFPRLFWLGVWRAAGYLRRGTPGDLLKAVYRQALLDLQPFVRRGQVLDSKWQNAPAEHKARALSAALFLADDVPAARRVLRRLLASFRSEDEAEELLLFTRFGNYPWREEIPSLCFRCGRQGATWRQIFSPPDNLPAAYRWRYDIPENHVPLCRVCANYAFPADKEGEEIRRLWGRAVWGVRFDAWERLHAAFVRGEFPRWDKDASPLWPPEYGGKEWYSGKGVFVPRYPRPYSVKRLAVHRDAARILFSRFPVVHLRLRETSLLLRVASQRRKTAPLSAVSRHA